ncbi:hypothetical protein C667_00245 [Thauera phenylacetica B4P]|uniref:Uncharacterized protein n=1 Tax=Thauera phenylacetica B4P TaxID=1234382 RepID=N6ZXI8_9RHOO|nr:hypothetical protein C667_00245 [Thauera phenylacetica B4P]
MQELIISRQTLSPSQHAALMAASERAIYSQRVGKGHDRAEHAFLGVTIRALLLRDCLASDELGATSPHRKGAEPLRTILSGPGGDKRLQGEGISILVRPTW